MVKKISFYTAFGQFLQMVERLAEQQEQELKKQQQVDTDRMSREHPLSDYQSAINSELQIESCPAAFGRPNGPVVVRKAVSCPLIAAALPGIELVPSPIPTSIESRKMNEATDLMMSFWKVHVTVRRPREEPTPSLFEKMEGLFDVRSLPSATIVSDPLFTDTPWHEISPSCKKQRRVVVHDERPDEDTCLTDASSDLTGCSWCDTWKSLDQPAVPQLPVFVKSPIDSLKVYQGRFQKTEEMADDELTTTPSDSTVVISGPYATSDDPTSEDLSSLSTVSSSSCETVVPNTRAITKTVVLQRTLIEKQKKIIKELIELSDISAELNQCYAESLLFK